MRNLFASAAVALAFTAIPAHAYTYIGGCSNAYISPAASACYGFYEGNVLDGSPDGLAAQSDALSQAVLGYTGPAVTQTSWNNIFAPTKINGPANDDEYVFGVPLYGETIVGIHFGNGAKFDGKKIFGAGNQGGGTAFFKFNAGSGIPNNLITAMINGGSSAVLYQTGTSPVPESATWGMMLLGFGAMGATMRRARVKKISFA